MYTACNRSFDYNSGVCSINSSMLQWLNLDKSITILYVFIVVMYICKKIKAKITILTL